MSGTTRITSADFGDTVPGVTQDTPTFDPSFMFKVPPLERLRAKVAIVGYTSHREHALELDDSFELWGLNDLYRFMPPERFHRWFEIHGRKYLSQDDEGKKHIEDLKTALGPLPIYMQHHHPDIRGSVRFPIGDLVEHFGGPGALGADYFTNCPAQMTAFAIALGYEEIHLYGIDMAQDSEYGTQRPCCEFWLGRALGMGIRVHVPEMSDLLKCIGTYGYEGRGSLLSRKLQDRIKYLHALDNDRLAALRKIEGDYQGQHASLTGSINRAEGGIAELEAQVWSRSERRADRLTELRAEVESLRGSLAGLEAEYQQKHAALARDRNQILGGIHNCEYFLTRWSMKADNPAGGNVPTVAERAADPQTGIQAPSGDSKAASAVTAAG